MTITVEDFGKRFQARIVEVLMKPLTEEEKAKAQANDPDWSEWTTEDATQVAEDEWEAGGADHHMGGYETDPEGSADEALSHWGDC